MKRLSGEQVTLVARRARALGDPSRVRILELLGQSEQHVGQIALMLKLPPSGVSKHLQVLFQAGLVHRRRKASSVIYWLADDRLLEWCRYIGTARLTRQPARA